MNLVDCANLTGPLARFIAETPGSEIPDATRDVLQMSLLDWMAVSLAGMDEPVARIIRGMVVAEGGAPQAHVTGHNRKLPARAAALANGTISHALDYDDTHFAHIGHPSVAVFPCALAVAEREQSTGRTLQEAALLGMEASIRIGLWLGRKHYQSGFHQTATAGAFGAAAAAARLMKLDAEQTAAALGLTATRASGVRSQFATMGKPFNAGIAAANGVEAATLVSAGFEPRIDGLECEQGFGPTHSGAADGAALDGLGRSWLFDSVTHKFHACCHGLHAALEAMAKLENIRPDEIEGIRVRTHPRWLSVCNIAKPVTGLEAKFSYRLTLAMAVRGHDTALPDNYTAEMCELPDLQTLRDLVTVCGDDRLGETEAVLSVTLRGGRERHARHDLKAGMHLEDRKSRVLAKAAALVGKDRAARLWKEIRAGANPTILGALLAGPETD